MYSYDGLLSCYRLYDRLFYVIDYSPSRVSNGVEIYADRLSYVIDYKIDYCSRRVSNRL